MMRIHMHFKVGSDGRSHVSYKRPGQASVSPSASASLGAQGSLPRWWRGRRLGSVLQAELHPARPVRWRRDPTLPGRRWVRCLAATRWHINRVWPRFSCRVWPWLSCRVWPRHWCCFLVGKGTGLHFCWAAHWTAHWWAIIHVPSEVGDASTFST